MKPTYWQISLDINITCFCHKIFRNKIDREKRLVPSYKVQEKEEEKSRLHRLMITINN